MKKMGGKLAFSFLTGAAILAGLYLFWARPFYKNWGATSSEIQSALPGDTFIPRGALVTTRALDIMAPPEKIWPWLIQLGHGRGGFYTYTWLERIFATDMVNAEVIQPELQLLKAGDPIAWRQSDSKATWTKVVLLDKPRTLVLEGGYTFQLNPLGPNHTRLLVRYVWDQGGLSYHLLFEPAHFVMESGMMLGLKRRAERPPSPPSTKSNNEKIPATGPLIGRSAPSKITGGKP